MFTLNTQCGTWIQSAICDSPGGPVTTLKEWNYEITELLSTRYILMDGTVTDEAPEGLVCFEEPFSKVYAKQFINIATGAQTHSWDITTDSAAGTIEFTEVGGDIKMIDASHIGIYYEPETEKTIISTEIGRYELSTDNVNEIDTQEPSSGSDIYDKIKDGLYA